MNTLYVIAFSIWATAVAGYVNHLLWLYAVCTSVDPMTNGNMVLAIIGTVMVPIGALHGVYMWFV